MKKGFTLIELLAVITILAIIALIIVPVTFNLVKKSKAKSLETSAYGLIKSAEYYKSGTLLNKNKKYPKTFESPNYDGLEINGQKKNGIVKIYKDGKIAVAIYDNNKCAYKTKNEEKVIVGDVKEQSECLNKLIIPICLFKENSIYECDVNDELAKEFYKVNEKDDTVIFMSTTNLDDNIYNWNETKNKISNLNENWTNVKVSIPTSAEVYEAMKIKSDDYTFWTKTSPSGVLTEIDSKYDSIIMARENKFKNIIATPVVPARTDCNCVMIVGIKNWVCIDGQDSINTKYPIRPTIVVPKSLVKSSSENV